MNKILAGALFAAVLVTTACSSLNQSRKSKEANPAPCPNIVVLSDAARLIEFDGEQTLDDVAYSAEIIDVTMNCRYFGDRPIDMEIKVDFAFGKGPKGVEGEKIFKYFVAVTRKDLEVIAKKEFLVPVDFDGDRIVVTLTEEINKIVIPRSAEETSGLNFEVIVGFALTTRQAIYNRSGKSLKFPNMQ